MTYFQGFVIPVKTGKRQAYLDMATKVAPIFAEYGALRTVECWGNDVPDGKVTDFRKAVQAKDDETVVFAWVWWRDKATCEAAAGKMMADERMKPDGELPFDGQRLIYGGFEVSFDTGAGGRLGYVDGVVASFSDANRQAVVDRAPKIARLFQENGALRVVNGAGVDVPLGKVTDLRRAVQAKEAETVIFGWIEWPDKATRDAGVSAMMRDPRMREMPPAWNGPLAIFGGFTPILDTGAA
ncbi:MAG TPA: DUF1428 domain-containing protein [Rhodopila sp.]